MTQRTARTIAAGILLALLSLLVYSLDRTSWLLAQYEVSQPGTLAERFGLDALSLGIAAALVIEVGAIALVAGDVLSQEQRIIQRYATAGLAVVLSVQALANLLAGYLRGWRSVDEALTAHDVSASLAWWIAGLAWVVSSAAVPALIFILSKLAAHTMRLAMSAPQSVFAQATDQRSEGAQERSVSLEAADPAISAPAPAIAPPERSENGAVMEEARALMVERLGAHADDRSTDQAIIQIGRYPCPFCDRLLPSGRAVGAAKTNGFCKFCKEERKPA
jgi:hypothetical protein